MQSGHATIIIIGDKIANGQTTAPNEIRGTSIEAREKQVLQAGDVLDVPARTRDQVIDTRAAFYNTVLKVDSRWDRRVK